MHLPAPSDASWSFPAPLIKSFHYSGHDGARTATRESSDFSFISVTVQMPRNFFTALGSQRKKKPKKTKKWEFESYNQNHICWTGLSEKNPSGLSVN